MPFDLTGYLARIDHDPLPVSPEGLTALQIAQLRVIPFENSEPLLGRVPDLAPSAIWRKLVVEKRGGYCLELNTLLGQALEVLGYQATPILGRVRMGAASGGPRAHLAHIVTLDGTEWLVDAGFGGPGPEAPLMLGWEAPAEQGCGTYRLRPDAATGEQVLERQTPDGWFALYGFDRVPVTAPRRRSGQRGLRHMGQVAFPEPPHDASLAFRRTGEPLRSRAEAAGGHARVAEQGGPLGRSYRSLWPAG
ncbi:N-hydroxyarylamine O-acetyltransferase [Rubellimicrobium mesophilum DSM 19309]|uniref:N-hydroxyarylamine O-acetyltransferase n=1 Tax=Rubellimicrobium mesophilum DSM 19309 TaxID=442562 RepID=A0A017HQY1_9RHOB|nr:arylamine N-acetyltransferase [Rubellimicrobium mesophilum]EYD76159.1 N-hydroxyarylamine O-acetyltransferase [Rubellimicrobium mesophilum DSM 19309]